MVLKVNGLLGMYTLESMLMLDLVVSASDT